MAAYSGPPATMRRSRGLSHHPSSTVSTVWVPLPRRGAGEDAAAMENLPVLGRARDSQRSQRVLAVRRPRAEVILELFAHLSDKSGRNCRTTPRSTWVGGDCVAGPLASGR